MYEYNSIIPLQERSNDVLTVGELLIDLIADEYDDPFQGNRFSKFFGGSPSNIAINSKKLGINTQVCSAVGDDGFGRFLVDQLRKAGLPLQTIQHKEAATSLVVVTRSTATPIPIFYGGEVFFLSFSAHLEASLQQSKVLHFSCWPLSRKPARETVEQMIETARRHNLFIGFDPNYHPMLWPSDEAGVQYVKSIIPKVDVIKPSEDDAERLFGVDTPYNQMEKFLSLGAKLVILTLGKDGALVSNGRETLSLPSMATEIMDTTGAGDSFWSGFYAAIVKRYTLEKALLLGFAVSAYKLKHAGAVIDFPVLEEIERQYFS
ncbi:sugar kinase [Escherichia coli]|nr:sugar kinase [Escherichia coli]